MTPYYLIVHLTGTCNFFGFMIYPVRFANETDNSCQNQAVENRCKSKCYRYQRLQAFCVYHYRNIKLCIIIFCVSSLSLRCLLVGNRVAWNRARANTTDCGVSIWNNTHHNFGVTIIFAPAIRLKISYARRRNTVVDVRERVSVSIVYRRRRRRLSVNVAPRWAAITSRWTNNS